MRVNAFGLAAGWKLCAKMRLPGRFVGSRPKLHDVRQHRAAVRSQYTAWTESQTQGEVLAASRDVPSTLASRRQPERLHGIHDDRARLQRRSLYCLVSAKLATVTAAEAPEVIRVHVTEAGRPALE